jgi:hypothetical protein
MKTMLSVLLFLVAGAAQAHESLVPHHHPHGVSMLPDLDSFVVGAILLIAVGLVAYAKFAQR